MVTLSVIVPVFNAELYLRKCIDSILHQTYTEFELVLVDDGSTDNSGYLCDEYEKKDNRVCVVHTDNCGVSNARNTGVRKSKGEYITFIDSDDWIYPSYLEELYQSVVIYNADMSITSIQLLGNETEQYGEGKKVIETGKRIVEYFGKENRQPFRAPMGKLVRREIIENNPFPVDRKYSEDLAVIYKWMFQSKRAVDTQTRLYCYNTDSLTSISNRPYNVHRLDNLKTLEEMILFYRENDMQELYDQFAMEYIKDIYWQYYASANAGCENRIRKFLKRKLRKAYVHILRKSNLDISTTYKYLVLAYPISLRACMICRRIKSKGVLETCGFLHTKIKERSQRRK